MAISQRLAELGIDLPQVVPPVASYVPAKAHGDLVYTSGQLPMVAVRLRGNVGGDRGDDLGEVDAELGEPLGDRHVQAWSNCLAAAAAASSPAF